jgi:hypothetical protein
VPDVVGGLAVFQRRVAEEMEGLQVARRVSADARLVPELIEDRVALPAYCLGERGGSENPRTPESVPK